MSLRTGWLDPNVRILFANPVAFGKGRDSEIAPTGVGLTMFYGSSIAGMAIALLIQSLDRSTQPTDYTPVAPLGLWEIRIMRLLYTFRTAGA